IVSNARLDLPEPDSPVMTTSASRGSSSEMSLRLCSRAPETTILLPDAIDETFYDGEQTFGCSRSRRAICRDPKHCIAIAIHATTLIAVPLPATQWEAS